MPAHAGTRGVMVTNTPDVLTEEVADTALGLLINTVRELPRAENWLRAGRWAKEGPYPLTPATLRGRRAGIFGMGRIGQAIARRLEAFGLPVAYHNRRQVEGLRLRLSPDAGRRWPSAVDTLISVAPGGAGDARRRSTPRCWRRSARTASSSISAAAARSTRTALVAALADGTILAAGLDVFADEPHVPQALLDLPNASLLPHVGSASVHTRNAMADLVVDNLVAWFSARQAADAGAGDGACRRRAADARGFADLLTKVNDSAIRSAIAELPSLSSDGRFKTLAELRMIDQHVCCSP